ncbi:hypothetical protein EMIHUDRAFT_200202 [Emiliania huxleyi CCMP1516]|uniref:HRDC domain-containing protein n=2 Tax=Emiliania huxleyi TaxID=2903 RepID=A0A0D3KV58_EMIH1|nr:hypothetical protein EMIHUDRAFT_200202 [Emiliania huxleyi CCMP1516]EOD39643.1 hypothetical protein EMIHUDRAFT_200202 [Emiliania huxleyi CCMP1516]|eukprot:XP_005792072.1 hypothetical protein EMIHUDRAFT_200202 [Emiliania huxleyi CCMP1516]
MFVVCNNRTMVDMCKRVPSSPKELRQCHGMGEVKGEKRRRKKKARRAVPLDGLSEEELLRMQQELFASARQHVIRLMDEREPAARFFERQIDSSGGCSKTRKRLRDLAATEPDDPAVAWLLATGVV